MQHWTKVLLNSGINVLGRESKHRIQLTVWSSLYTSIAIVTTLLDADWCIMVREIRGRNWSTMNCSSPYFNWTFVQEKSRCMVATICIDRHKNKHILKSCKNIFKVVQKRKRKFFEQDNCYLWDMDMGFQAWIKILKQCLEVMNFSASKKILLLTV